MRATQRPPPRPAVAAMRLHAVRTSQHRRLCPLVHHSTAGLRAAPSRLQTNLCRKVCVSTTQPCQHVPGRRWGALKVCQAAHGGEASQNPEAKADGGEDANPTAPPSNPQADWGGEAPALASWEAKEKGGNWKGLAALASLVVICAIGAKLVFQGIIGALQCIPNKPDVAPTPPTAQVKEEKESEKGVGMEPEDLWGSKDTSEEWSGGRSSSSAAAFGDSVAPVMSSVGPSALRADLEEGASWDNEELYGSGNGAGQGEEDQSETARDNDTRSYSWPEEELAIGSADKETAAEESTAEKEIPADKESTADEGRGLPAKVKPQKDEARDTKTETDTVTEAGDESKGSEGSGPLGGLSRTRSVEPSADKGATSAATGAAAASTASGEAEQQETGGTPGKDQTEKEAKLEAERVEAETSMAAAAARRLQLDKDRAEKEIKKVMETKFDDQERTVPKLPDMSMNVEMPPSAVDPTTLRLLEGNTLQASAQRSAVALAAATAASEASNRAAAYAAAASSASSKAAEAAHWAAVAARTAHSGMEAASEEAILAAECRVEAASRVAKAAEDKAAAAAGMSAAYQDIAQTQKDVAEKAAKVEPEGRELPRERWLAGQLDWMQMSPMWAKVMAFTEPLRDFLGALWGKMCALGQAAVSAVQKLLQAILSIFTRGG